MVKNLKNGVNRFELEVIGVRTRRDGKMGRVGWNFETDKNLNSGVNRFVYFSLIKPLLSRKRNGKNREKFQERC